MTIWLIKKNPAPIPKSCKWQVQLRSHDQTPLAFSILSMMPELSDRWADVDATLAIRALEMGMPVRLVEAA